MTRLTMPFSTHLATAGKHLSARLHADAPGRLREQPDGGIVLDAQWIDLGEDAIALVTVADLSGIDGGRNTGQSATNALDSVISLYHELIVRELSVRDASWISIDSMGAFDHVICKVNGRCIALDWRPLLSGLHQGRTERDFVAIYGHAAKRTMAVIRGAASHRH